MAHQKTRKVAADTLSPRKSQRRAAPATSEIAPTLGPSQRKANAPSRCGRCEGQPLRSQCEHTKQGRDYILAQEASKNIEKAISQDGPPSFHASPCTCTPEPNRESPAETTPACMDESVPPWNDHVIDPTLLAMSTPGHSDAGTLSVAGANTPGVANTPRVSEPGASEAASSLGTPKSKCIRATASKALFGHVEGVCRGFTPHDVYRKHIVPEPIPEGAHASKTFLEKMNSLCEDISIKTGAWLFVGAQHPAATGGSINYSLPRLHTDGGQKMSEFATMFLKLIKKVADNKCRDAFEFQKIIEAEREKKEQIQKDLEAVRAQAASDSQELALFRERFGSLEGSN